MDVISRADAKNHGFIRYFTGKPCIKGHISERYVTNGACINCVNFENPQFMKINVRTFPDKAYFLFRLLNAVNVARDPLYPEQGTSKPRKPVAGTYEFSFRCHPLDIPAVNRLVMTVNSAGPEVAQAIRQRVFAAFRPDSDS